MTTTTKGSTIFSAVRIRRSNKKTLTFASFFSYSDARDFMHAQIAKEGANSDKFMWVSDPTFVHTTEHGYKDHR